MYIQAPRSIAVAGPSTFAIAETYVGKYVGDGVGTEVGTFVGTAVGLKVGFLDGNCVGTELGLVVGNCVGKEDIWELHSRSRATS